MKGVEYVSQRANHLIDPSMQIWHWEVPIYLFLGGMVAGIMIVAALLERFWPDVADKRISFIAPIASFVLLSLGMVALLFDLELKLHVFRFYLAFKPTSPMSWGSWILMLAYPAIILWWLGSLGQERKERLFAYRFLGLLSPFCKWAEDNRQMVIQWTAGIGVSLGIYTGILLQAYLARPLWNSALLGPLFLVSGISTGTAFLMLWRTNEKTHDMLVRWDIWALSIELLLLTLFLMNKAMGTGSHLASFKLLVGGPYTGAFFALVMGAGILVPLFLEWRELKHKAHSRYLVPALVLVGGFALRAVLVAAGQTSSLKAMSMLFEKGVS